MSWLNTAGQALAENTIAQRLAFASLELVVLAVVLALILRLARFSSQRLVACLWLIVIAKPLVTLAAGAPIALWRIEPSAGTTTVLARSYYAPVTTVPNGSQTASSTSAAAALAPVVSDAADVVARTQADSVAREGVWRTESTWIGSVLLGTWAIGSLLFAVRFGFVRWRLSRLVRRAQPASAECRRMYASIARELGRQRLPTMRVSDELDTPALVGATGPMVLLPRRLVQECDEHTIGWAIRHELAHWRWHDPLAILVRDVVSVVFFFHPLLPWIRRRHADAMELACDWESLRHPSEAPVYAESLARILVLLRDPRPPRAMSSTLAMATPGRMTRRIGTLLEGEPARPLTPAGVAGVMFTASLVFAVGCDVTSVPKQSDPTREAVLAGLTWLARHQNADGSWSPTTIADTCSSEEPIYRPKDAYTNRMDEGATGLALLSFLEAGYGDASGEELADGATGRSYRTGEVVEKGLSWLTRRQKPDGSFGSTRPFMYCEAIAGMALAQAAGRSRGTVWTEPAQRSMDFIQAAQRPSPDGAGWWGWRYASRQEVEGFARGGEMNDQKKRELHDSDISVTNWCMLALRAGANAGLNVSQDHFAGGLAFARFVTDKNGMVGYLDPRGAGAKVTGKNDHYTYHPVVMSALGMCTRVSAGDDVKDAFNGLAAQQLVKDLPAISADKLSIDYYYWHFGTLALQQFDGTGSGSDRGRYWNPWRKATVEALLALQDKNEKTCASGGWTISDRWAYSCGPIYTTAMNVLTLSVCATDASPAASAETK